MQLERFPDTGLARSKPASPHACRPPASSPLLPPNNNVEFPTLLPSSLCLPRTLQRALRAAQNCKSYLAKNVSRTQKATDGMATTPRKAPGEPSFAVPLALRLSVSKNGGSDLKSYKTVMAAWRSRGGAGALLLLLLAVVLAALTFQQLVRISMRLPAFQRA